MGGGGTGPRPSSPLSAITFSPSDRERLQSFLARLARMSKEERLNASRYKFNGWQLRVWAGRYPDEVPTVNGEFEWITAKLE